MKISLVMMLILLLLGCQNGGLGTSGGDLVGGSGGSTPIANVVDCYEASVRELDPVIYFRFDESLGAVTSFDSGSAENEPINSGVTFGSEGVFTRSGNKAAYFDGSSHLEIGDHAYNKITGSQTIEAWVKPEVFGARRNYFSKAYGGEGTITLEPAANLNYYYGTSGANAPTYQGANSVGKVNLAQWNHIVLVRDLDNSRIHWYINGVRTANLAANYPNATAGNLKMFLGKGYVNNFIGHLDEFALYDKALSSDEISEHYNLATIGCSP